MDPFMQVNLRMKEENDSVSGTYGKYERQSRFKRTCSSNIQSAWKGSSRRTSCGMVVVCMTSTSVDNWRRSSKRVFKEGSSNRWGEIPVARATMGAMLGGKERRCAKVPGSLQFDVYDSGKALSAVPSGLCSASLECR